MGRQDALVVVNHRSHRLLAEHLAATAEGLGARVVVVDNWSDARERDDVRALAERHGWELVEAPNDGFGAGVNLGVARAQALGCDTFLLLNPDLSLATDAAAALLDAARSDPLALVGPTILRPDGGVWSVGGTLDLATGRTRTRPDLVGSDPQWLTGACLAVHATLWERVGGFADDYFMYWEDVDLSYRVTQAGGRLVVADVTAVHDVGGTQDTAGSRRRSDLYYRYNTRGRLVFAGRHLDRAGVRSWARGSVAYARAVVLRGGRRQLLRSPGPVWSVLRGTVEGLRYARRTRGTGTSGTSGTPGAAAAARGAADGRLHVVIAHPSPDLYGSDRQMLESVDAVLGRGGTVDLVLPASGPLAPLAHERGATVVVAPYPVLRKALLHPRRLPGLVWHHVVGVARATAFLRRTRPTLLYVNTVTIPVWVVAGRLARVPVLVHVHEAEEAGRLVRVALASPLLLARRVVTNSQAAAGVVTGAIPALSRRTVVVHNGVAGPPQPVDERVHRPGEPWHLVVVGRLSPRKGIDVALEAAALLVARGLDVRLSVAGTVFPGYEWFEEQLRARAAQDDLAGRVALLGYVHPTWDLVADADVVLVPSLVEPFGNTAVEGMLACRPVVASRTQGLVEVAGDGRSALLVPPGDAGALADAVAGLLADDDARASLARAGAKDAGDRFTTTRYAERLTRVIDDVVGSSPGRRAGDL